MLSASLDLSGHGLSRGNTSQHAESRMGNWSRIAWKSDGRVENIHSELDVGTLSDCCVASSCFVMPDFRPFSNIIFSLRGDFYNEGL